MRALGYRTVDALVDWLCGREHPQPEAPEPYDEALELLLPAAEPRFLASVPFAGTWPGALGDLVASACDVDAGEASGQAQVELELLRWFADRVGYPAAAGGIVTSGGAAANLTALACAREALAGPVRDDLVVYCSDQAGASVARGLRLLGFGGGQVRVLPVADDLRLEPATLAAAVAADEVAGRRPLALVANGGTASTGAVDPVAELAPVCREHRVWLHVDAAYGGFGILGERGRAQLGDLSAADSIALGAPSGCSVLLLREPDDLRRAALAELGLQQARGAPAFGLWLSLRTFGLDAFREATERTLELAALAAERIGRSDRLELAAPTSLGVVCFRRLAEQGTDEELEVRGLVAALEASGLGLVAPTRVHGRPALRLCSLDRTTRAQDVEAVLSFLERAEPLATAAAGDDRMRRPPEALPLLSRLRPEEAELLAALGTTRLAADGETIVERFGEGRELYVLERGLAEVRVDGRAVTFLRNGDCFGEIAALDWEPGFARPHSATVVAVAETRLRVLSPDEVARLLAGFPRLEAELRLLAHERLRRAR